MKLFKAIIVLVCLSIFQTGFGQSKSDSTSESSTRSSSQWYDKIRVRGYGQLRYNRLLETNENLGCEQCDKSWGNDGGLFLRRMRIVFSGQIHPRLFFYFQQDFASSASSSGLHFGQLKDAYFDLGLDKDNVFRLRLGQSKIPFGFENLQSSSNRLPLDRNDALNSAVKDERDLAAIFYWASKEKKKLISEINSQGLKGSGDYGVFGFGIYNGQTANKPEQNDEFHLVSRFSYPFKVGEQILEPGIQAYTGKYVISKDNISPGVSFQADRNYTDERVALSFILYPKPFGIQAEYNIGRGPEYNKLNNSIEVNNLHGGYATLSYRIAEEGRVLIPFARYQYYDGGKKHERDARSYEVKEFELGVEWSPFRAFELVVMYTISDRRYEDALLPDNHQKGSLLRIQTQLNF